MCLLNIAHLTIRKRFTYCISPHFDDAPLSRPYRFYAPSHAPDPLTCASSEPPQAEPTLSSPTSLSFEEQVFLMSSLGVSRQSTRLLCLWRAALSVAFNAADCVGQPTHCSALHIPNVRKRQPPSHKKKRNAFSPLLRCRRYPLSLPHSGARRYLVPPCARVGTRWKGRSCASGSLRAR